MECLCDRLILNLFGFQRLVSDRGGLNLFVVIRGAGLLEGRSTDSEEAIHALHMSNSHSWLPHLRHPLCALYLISQLEIHRIETVLRIVVWCIKPHDRVGWLQDSASPSITSAIS
jgi:hypothetical protein